MWYTLLAILLVASHHDFSSGNLALVSGEVLVLLLGLIFDLIVSNWSRVPFFKKG